MDNGLPPLHKCWGKIRTLLKKEIDLKTIFYCSCWRSQLCYCSKFSLLYDRWRGASSCGLKLAERSLEDCMCKWNQNAWHAWEDEGHWFCVNIYPAMVLLHYWVQLKEERPTGHSFEWDRKNGHNGQSLRSSEKMVIFSLDLNLHPLLVSTPADAYSCHSSEIMTEHQAKAKACWHPVQTASLRHAWLCSTAGPRLCTSSSPSPACGLREPGTLTFANSLSSAGLPCMPCN